MKSIFQGGMLAMAGWALVASAAYAGDGYPDKPIKLVVPYPPGGIADTFSRALAQNLSDQFKQPVLVENKPGANQIIGVETVLRAPADGYTLFLASMTSLATNLGAYRELSYDPVKDFAPVSHLFASPLILTVGTNTPVQTVDELVALAKERPGELTYASLGDGGSLHLAGELFGQAANIDLLRVPYKGSVQALADVVGGSVTMIFDAGTTAIPQIQGGRARALAVTSDTRLPGLPDVPTMAEAGYPTVDIGVWWGLAVRSGTPDAILATLNQAVVKALENPAFAERFRGTGLSIQPSSLEDFTRFVSEEARRWPRFMAEVGVVPLQ
ncbi:MAG: tripartite tricarboxylate transporter substrate binding protein [Pigmentiphaga sp.]|nr:tripartite tricarboxylate transporter substrate binding protein [Pigmentiphaga sp.]